MNCHPLHRTRFGLAWVAVLVFAALFRLALPPMLVADASIESICTADGKPVGQKVDSQSGLGMHSHAVPCDYCLLGLDNLVGFPNADIRFAFSNAIATQLHLGAISQDINVSWATPYSRAPPFITV